MNEMTLSGSSVASDTNNDNFVSMNEGFVYARDNDWYYGNLFSSETPQFYSSPSTFGYTHSLYGEIFSGTLVGPDEISDQTGGVYDMTGLTNIVWETDNPICDAAYQGRTYVDFNTEPYDCATEVWCSFNNRFGEYVKLKYRLSQ